MENENADVQLWDRQCRGQWMAIPARRQYWKGYGDVKLEKPTNQPISAPLRLFAYFSPFSS
jgi:hypothetical protein